MVGGVDRFRAHRYAVHAGITAAERTALASGRWLMSQPTVSVYERSWMGLAAASICIAVGSVVCLSLGSPLIIAATIGALAYTLFAVYSVRHPLMFALVFLFVLEVCPPLYFSQTGE